MLVSEFFSSEIDFEKSKSLMAELASPRLLFVSNRHCLYILDCIIFKNFEIKLFYLT